MKIGIRWAMVFVLVFPAIAAQDSPLTSEQIAFLVELGKSEDEIVAQIRKRRVSFDLTEEASAALRQKQVTDRVLAVIREVRLLDRVVSLKKEGADDSKIVWVIAESGVTLELSTDDALMLSEKGVSLHVIKALQGQFSFPDCETFEHAGGFFGLQHPKDWRKMEEFQDERFVFAFTPDHSASTVALLGTSVQIQVGIVGPDSPHHYLPIEEIGQKNLKLLEVERRSRGEFFQLLELPKRGGLKGFPVAQSEFKTEVGGAKIRCRYLLSFSGGIEYSILCTAPETAFEETEPLFRKILLSFHRGIGESGTKVRKPTADSKKLLDKYRESVVAIVTMWTKDNRIELESGGTGFLARKDGYVLTNHHVVWDDELARYADIIEIHWDSVLKRQPLRVALVDAVKSDYPYVDVALLKAKGTNFLPVPMTRVNPWGENVQEAHRVMALGYPAITDAKSGIRTVTYTDGALAKVDLLPGGKVENLIITAPIHGGNSGGPCFDLETHGVIGLTTTSKWDLDALRYGVAVGSQYHGIVPIDAAFEAFPEILAYPGSFQNKFQARDYLSLAIQFYNQGLYKPALRQIKEALNRENDMAEAYAVAGDVWIARRESQLAKQWYEAALRYEQNQVRALMGLAKLESDKAIGYYTQVILADPKNHRAYAARSRIHTAEKRYEDALRDGRKAAELGMGLYSEPHCLIGGALYDLGQYDEGLKEFQKASQIDPRDSEARFGQTDYHYVQRDYDATMREAERAAGERKEDPAWQMAAGDRYHSIAQQYDQEKRTAESNFAYEKAYAFYLQARKLSLDQGRLMDSPMLTRIAWIARTVKVDYPTVETVCSDMTWQSIRVGDDQKRAHDLYLQYAYAFLASSYQNQKIEGLAGAFFQAAANLGDLTSDWEWTKEQVKAYKTPLRFEEVDHLRRLDLHPLAVLDVIHAWPLGFSLSEAKAKELKELRWPQWLLSAMLKKQPEDTGASGVTALISKWEGKDRDLVVEASKIPLKDLEDLFQKSIADYRAGRGEPAASGFKKIFYRVLLEEKGLTQDMLVIAIWSSCHVAYGYSRQGKKEDALDWLELSSVLGLLQLGQYTQELIAHKDLDNIRKEPRFLKIVQGTGDSTPAGKGSIGARLRDLTAEECRKWKLKEGVGVLLTEATQDGPASRAGLKAQDVIVRVNDELVGKSADVARWFESQAPGARVPITYLRFGEFFSTEVVVGKAP